MKNVLYEILNTIHDSQSPALIQDTIYLYRICLQQFFTK